MTYDYLIVGSGLFGATFANLAKNSGKKCLIIEKRKHIAGNCYTKNILDINVHVYGPHIFHTSNKQIWDYVNKFATFNSFVNRPKVNYKNNIYAFPINLFTLYQMWGCITPIEAHTKLESVKIKIENPQNFEEWILSQVGEEIYKIFIYGYTKKHWGTDPKNLPVDIIKRLPIRLSFDDNYYTDIYQGVPIGGYTKMVENMISDIPIETDVDFLNDIEYWMKRAKTVVYTGALDELFKYKKGKLQYRSLEFKQEILDVKDFQGNAVINYTDESVPFTRIVEHKHFEFNNNNSSTVITKEFPQNLDVSKEKYYPINDVSNNELYNYYQIECSKSFENIILGGRLACYRYLDMHQVIGQAMHKFGKTLSVNNHKTEYLYT